MLRPNSILDHMKRLIELFAPHVQNRGSMDKLLQMIDGTINPSHAHQLFSGIRGKTNTAAGRGDMVALRQYEFEEICAKTIYNVTGNAAPFDPDSPYWVIPHALWLAKELRIDRADVLAIVER